MTNEDNTIRAVPLSGIAMDPSGLFGLERGADNLVRAIGPANSRSRWAVIPEVAEALTRDWMPDSDFISHLRNHDAESEALDEACQFLRAWDIMAAGAVKSWMQSASLDCVCLAVRGIAEVQPDEDGLVYLKMPSGIRSRWGLRPGAALMMISQWEGIDGAVNLAAEYVSTAGQVQQVLMDRWNQEAKALSQSLCDQPIGA